MLMSYSLVLDKPPALAEDLGRGSTLRPGDHLHGWGISAMAVVRSLLCFFPALLPMYCSGPALPVGALTSLEALHALHAHGWPDHSLFMSEESALKSLL